MKRIVTGLALFGALAACGSKGGTDPGPTQAPALTITAAVPGTGMVSGTTIQATVTTSSGGAVSGAVWRSSDAQIAAVTSEGLITAKKAGHALITAQSGASVGSLNVGVVPGAPASIVIYAGDGQSAAKNTALHDPLCTNVLDAAGNMIIGVNVTYAVASGGGSIQPPTTAATDTRGISTSGTWILGPDAGTQTVVATTGGFSVTFKATAQ